MKVPWMDSTKVHRWCKLMISVFSLSVVHSSIKHSYNIQYTKYIYICLFLIFICWFIFRVKLAVNTDTQEAVAVKIINLEKTTAAAENVRKEVKHYSGLICSRILKKNVFFIYWLWNLKNSHNFVTLFSYLFIFCLPLFKRGRLVSHRMVSNFHSNFVFIPVWTPIGTLSLVLPEHFIENVNHVRF